jgi:membrane protein
VIRTVIESLRNFLLTPSAELNRWQLAGQYFVELCMHGAGELRRDRAPQMAAALAYRTLFSIVPLMVVSVVVLRWVSGPEGFREPLRAILAYLGLENLTVPTEVATETEPAQTALDALLGMVESAQNAHFGTVGLVGLAILIYAAMSLLIQVESSFNFIYNASSGRSWPKRVTQYWTLVTLGPLLLIASFRVQAQVQGWVAGLHWGALLVSFAGFALTVCISWLLLLLAYKTVTNSRVNVRTALAGSFVAAILWELGKYGFTLYAGNLTGYGKIYGSLALLPIFMLWVYLTWLIVLFGLELSYTLQTLGGHRERLLDAHRQAVAGRHEANLVDPATMLSLLEQIGRRFQEGKPISAGVAAQEAGVSPTAAKAMLRQLVSVGLLHMVEHGADAEDAAYALARPAERIALASALEQGFALSDAAPHAEANEKATLQALRRVQLESIAGQSLADLLGSSSRPDADHAS